LTFDNVSVVKSAMLTSNLYSDETIAPDGDITGTSEMFALELKIYPNPFTGKIVKL